MRIPNYAGVVAFIAMLVLVVWLLLRPSGGETSSAGLNWGRAEFSGHTYVTARLGAQYSIAHDPGCRCGRGR